MSRYSSLVYISSLALGLLDGCRPLDKLATVGETPPLTHIQNPSSAAGYQPVTMPMPTPQAPVQRANSLWQTGARAFFKDQRACRVGDILTVLVSLQDKADIQNNTSVSRQSSELLGLKNFLGLEGTLGHVLPKQFDPKNAININSNPQHQGTGAVSRKETIELKLAATVIQILPNGNLVLSGRQEFRINYDVRQVLIEGIVRPEDITSANTISYEKIAEARISYGGRGMLDDQQQPRWGFQVLDAISPL